MFKIFKKNIQDRKNRLCGDDIAYLCQKTFEKKYKCEGKNFSKNQYAHLLDGLDFKSIKGEDFIVFSEIYEEFLSHHHREKTGTYYTPYYMIEYMVYRSLEIYINKKLRMNLKELEKINHFTYEQYENILEIFKSIKIIDIACGTGMFLVSCLKVLFKYQKILYGLLEKPVDDFQIKKSILENNLFGIDLQEQAIDIAKTVLLAITYGEDQPHDNLKIHLNFFVGDSLIQNEVFENEHLKKIIKDEEGFDLVIGNPPYVGEKGNKELFNQVKHTEFGMQYYEGKMDYFYFFIYKGLEILKENAILCYITTNYFVTADGAKKLRKHLRENTSFIDIINFNNYEIFPSAKGQHNMIFTLQKGYNQDEKIMIRHIKQKNMGQKELTKGLYDVGKDSEGIVGHVLEDQEKLYDDVGNIAIQIHPNQDRILKKILAKKDCMLGEICNIRQGLVSGADKVTENMLQRRFSQQEISSKNIQPNEGIFILSYEEAKYLGVLDCCFLKPLYKNSNIQKYQTKKMFDKYVLYIHDTTLIDQRTLKHLSKYKEVLIKRREVMRNVRRWYALQWPRKQEMFEGTKIVVPHRSKMNKFALCSTPWYASADVYFICEDKQKINWHWLLGILNSKIIYFWLYYRGKRKGNDLELYATPLKGVPIIKMKEDEDSKAYVRLVKEMMETGYHANIQNQLDKILYQKYGLNKSEIDEIESLYFENIEK